MTDLERDRELSSLRATDVTVRYGGLRALDSVTVAVRGGSVTGLIGPNGAGKSTLLGVLSGLTRPQAGDVFVGDVRSIGLAPQRVARLGVARSFQAPQLVPELTVKQHIVMAHASSCLSLRSLLIDMLGVGRKAATAEEGAFADSLLSEIGLSGLGGTRSEMLPLGLRRLVEVAQCLSMSPRFLLLDEPSAGLNAAETESLANFLRTACAQRGIGVLLVEHDVELVLSVSEYVYVLDFGQLISQGSPKEISADPAVQKAYLGMAVEV